MLVQVPPFKHGEDTHAVTADTDFGLVLGNDVQEQADTRRHVQWGEIILNVSSKSCARVCKCQGDGLAGICWVAGRLIERRPMRRGVGD